MLMTMISSAATQNWAVVKSTIRLRLPSCDYDAAFRGIKARP
jgi:hypothetical protein